LPSSSKKPALSLTKLMNLDVMQYLFYDKNFLTFLFNHLILISFAQGVEK